MNSQSTSEPFAWRIRVYYEDTDAQGLVYYANYFKFMERARTEWLRALGVEQDALLYEERKLFVVIDTRCEFLVPAKFNDEIVATAALSDLSRATFSMEQNIFRNNLDGELLCRGTTKAAFLNADTLKPIRVPADLFEDSKS